MKAPEIVEICPTCDAKVEGICEDPLSRVYCPHCNGEIVVSQKIDNYQLVDVLDQGNRGIVYRAHDATLGRDVALKVLRSKVQDTQLVGHLSSEAKAMGRLSHPHVVRVLSAGNDRGRYYTAMELSGHGSLRNLVTRQGPLPEVEVLNLGIQIAEGLQAASTNGLVHGRVRPQNVLYSDQATAKIGNFGVTITSDEDDALYDAPEVLEKPTSSVSGDIYSLGATLIFALTGRPPFAVQCSDLNPLPALKARPVDLQALGVHVHDGTSAVLSKMMQPDPSQRFQSYDTVIAHLQAAKSELFKRQLAPSPSHAAPNAPSHAASRSGVRAAVRPATQPVKAGSSVHAVSPAQENGKPAGGLPKSGKARLWIIIGASALILGIGSAVLFRNPPSSSGKQNPSQKQRTPVVIEEPEQDSVPAYFGTEFAAAHQLFASHQYKAAADAFRNVHQSANSAPIVIEWALLHEGMALTASGNLRDGQSVFQKLKARTIDPNQPKELQESFRKIAALAAEPGPPSTNLAPLFNNNNHETIALLTFGLKSWEMKKFPEALVFFRQFQLARPAGKYAWIARLKPVASRLQDEYTASLMPARPTHETPDSEKPKPKKVVGQKEILANTIPDDQRAKVAPGIYTLVNFVSKKYLAIDPNDQSGIKLVESESHDQPQQHWEIVAASPDKHGVYTLKSAASGKVIDFSGIPWGITRVLDIPPDRTNLVTNWIFASTENDGYYRLVSETALGSISTATDWEKGAERNGIEIRIGHFSVSLWKLEKIEKK
jgi:eukaryotic-like serine/threonine-protein kinase